MTDAASTLKKLQDNPKERMPNSVQKHVAMTSQSWFEKSLEIEEVHFKSVFKE